MLFAAVTRPATCPAGFPEIIAFFIPLAQAVHALRPLDRRVQSHIVGPVAAQVHPVDAYRIYDEAQRGRAMREAVIEEAVEVRAGRMGNVDASLGSDLPPSVEMPRAEAGEAASVT